MADNLNYAIPANELFFYFLIYLGRIKYQFILLCTILSLIHFVFSNIKIAPLPHPPFRETGIYMLLPWYWRKPLTRNAKRNLILLLPNKFLALVWNKTPNWTISPLNFLSLETMTNTDSWELTSFLLLDNRSEHYCSSGSSQAFCSRFATHSPTVLVSEEPYNFMLMEFPLTGR